MARRNPEQIALGRCLAIGCSEVLAPSSMFCDRHWAMLQWDIQTILARKFRSGRRQTIVFAITLERAQQEILFCQTAGYRTPRDAEFEW